jgi:hypothetical protein
VPELSPADMRAIVERHVELWNAGGKAAWIAHLKQSSSGGFSMEDPVGTPTKRGHDILSEVWDNSFSQGAFTLSVDHLVTGGNEVAILANSNGTIDGAAVVVRSIEIYRFGDDDSLHIRAFWDIPAGSAYGEWTAATGS